MSMVWARAHEFRIQNLSRNRGNQDLSLTTSVSYALIKPFYIFSGFFAVIKVNLLFVQIGWASGKWRIRRAYGEKEKCHILLGKLFLKGEIFPTSWSLAGICSRQKRSTSAITNILAGGCRKLSFYPCLSLKDELWLLEKERSLPEASILTIMLIKIKNNALRFIVHHSEETHLLQEPLPFFSYLVNKYLPFMWKTLNHFPCCSQL